MIRKLIAVIALLAANAALAMPDLDREGIAGASEATSYVPIEQQAPGAELGD
jgi:hypothetical protein